MNEKDEMQAKLLKSAIEHINQKQYFKCPNCGGEASIAQWITVDEWIFINCPSCDIFLLLDFENGIVIISTTDTGWISKIIKWNADHPRSVRVPTFIDGSIRIDVPIQLLVPASEEKIND